MKKDKENLKKVLVFLFITSIISTGIFIWMFGGVGDSLIAVLPMMFTPGISALITSLIFKEKLRSFAWKLGKPKYLLYAYIMPLAVSIIGYGIFWLTKYGGFSADIVVNYQWAELIGFNLPVPFIVGALSKMIIAFLLTTLIVFGEELGWSGYLTPKLRKSFSASITSIIVGFYWAAWHYPAIIGGFYGYGAPLWISLPGFTLVLIGASFLRTVLVEKAKSLWPGVIVHASHNVILMGMFLEMTKQTGELNLNYIVSETVVFLGIIYILVSVLFWKIILERKKLKHIK